MNSDRLLRSVDLSAVLYMHTLVSLTRSEQIASRGISFVRVCSFDNGPFDRVTSAIIVLVPDVFEEDTQGICFCSRSLVNTTCMFAFSHANALR